MDKLKLLAAVESQWFALENAMRRDADEIDVTRMLAMDQRIYREFGALPNDYAAALAGTWRRGRA